MSSSEEEEAQFDEEEDDDVPLASLRRESEGSRSSRKRKAVDYTDGGGDGDDDDDDDDDVPLSSLKKKSPSKPKPKAAATKKKAKPAPKSPVKSSSSGSKSGDYLSASAALYESDCKKGVLIQKLLCRWWYAVTWPDPATLPEEAPKHYDKLNGFEGVYICTSGDKVGQILDLRDKEACPSFALYARKPAKELKEMLLKALEEQKRQLIEAEGEGTPTEKEINDDIKLVKRIKPDEAEKEAAKILKAAKMKLQ